MRKCDSNCNECEVITHKNSKVLTQILNEAYDKYGDEFYAIVQKHCPNMTVCYDCRIDDFCHMDGCELINT